jgi:hypothetical protein
MPSRASPLIFWIAVVQIGRGGVGGDDRGQMQLAADDRRMACDPAAVGDERGGAAHGRHPVRAGHRRDEHITVDELVRLHRRPQDPHRARDPAGRGAEPGHEHALVERHAERRAFGDFASCGRRVSASSVVIGRVWTSEMRWSSSMANSMSCGQP